MQMHAKDIHPVLLMVLMCTFVCGVVMGGAGACLGCLFPVD
jgi:hypothetical protein